MFLELMCKPASECNVVYLGTATYDLPVPKEKQTRMLKAAGCNVIALEVANVNVKGLPTYEEMLLVLTEYADAIIVSGGNTLYAMTVWKHLKLDKILRIAALEKNIVIGGGSAGAICWFTGGHSDSADPATFKRRMEADWEKERFATVVDGESKSAADPTTAKEGAATNPTSFRPWSYLRVSALDLLPGLVCPHFDSTQSNGVPRSSDFDKMLGRHCHERGVCIDHGAVLVITGPAPPTPPPETTTTTTTEDKEKAKPVEVVVDADAAATALAAVALAATAEPSSAAASAAAASAPPPVPVLVKVGSYQYASPSVDRYHVVSLSGHGGSAHKETGEFTSDKTLGRPCIWLKDCVEGVIVTTLCPTSGVVTDLFRRTPYLDIMLDLRVDRVKRDNPME